MQGIVKLIFCSCLLFSSGALQAQMALEYAQDQGMMELIQKGDTTPQAAPTALFYTDAFSPQAADFKDPVWIEFVLNEIKLPVLIGSWEVLYLVPENSQEVIAIVKRGEKVGYLRFIQVVESSEDP